MAQSGEGDCANFFGRCQCSVMLPDIFRPALADAFPRPVRVPCDQAATSCSSADLLWMIKVEPFSSTTSFFLNSDSMRVIDSRLVPMIWAISSWVIASLARTTPFVTCPSVADASRNFATLPETECDNPMERATIKTVSGQTVRRVHGCSSSTLSARKCDGEMRKGLHKS
jgi:hypothetical protein